MNIIYKYAGSIAILFTFILAYWLLNKYLMIKLSEDNTNAFKKAFVEYQQTIDWLQNFRKKKQKEEK